jgi:hypothetical protein
VGIFVGGHYATRGHGSTLPSRDKSVAAFLQLEHPTTAYLVRCDKEPSVGSSAYPCSVRHDFHDDGWLCVTFNSKNEVVNFERGYIADACG